VHQASAFFNEDSEGNLCSKLRPTESDQCFSSRVPGWENVDDKNKLIDKPEDLLARMSSRTVRSKCVRSSLRTIGQMEKGILSQ
jgi:hypothetical protein